MTIKNQKDVSVLRRLEVPIKPVSSYMFFEDQRISQAAQIDAEIEEHITSSIDLVIDSDGTIEKNSRP